MSKEFLDFIHLVEKMRECQQCYFKTRDKAILIASKQLETSVDKFIAEYSHDEEADARLIAAAPEMYYLLKELTKELSAYGDDVREDLYSLMIEAEEVLARIDGEEAQA